MAFAELFTKDVPYFFEHKPEGFDLWEQVYLQAIDHTQKSDHSRLLAKRRPSEPKEIHEYRMNNIRNITRSTVVRASNKASRIFKASGVSLSKGDISPALREWVTSERCQYMNQSVNFEEFAYRCLFLLSIEDPNGATVVFPFNPANPKVPPMANPDDGGLPDTEMPDIEIDVISYSRIVYWSKKMFSYRAKTKWTFKHNGKDRSEDWFWVIDDEWWYQYVPTGVNADNKVIYKLQKWYRHDTGLEGESVLPVARMPGRIKTDGDIKYHESFLSPAFEYLDEVVVSFSDTSSLRVRHQHPISIYADLPCMAKGCDGGRVRFIDPKTKKADIKKCEACNGTGRGSDPGIHGKFIRAKTTLDTNNNIPAVDFATPPQEPLRDCYNMTFDLFERGNRVIGLDLLTNDGVESGEAKRRRLEDLSDMLADIGPMFFQYLTRILFYVESILERNRVSRIRPVIQLPITYDTRDLEILKDDAQNAVSSDKIESLLTYYQRKYQNNPDIVRIYELALEYAPALQHEVDERIRLKAAGVFSDNDMIKAEHVVFALKNLKEKSEGGVFNLSKEKIFELIDKALEAVLIPDPLAEFDADGNLISGQPKNKLLETVGGVTGIIEVSRAVAEGSMTEQAAENLLVEVFGFSSEKARKLIELPDGPPTIEPDGE